MIALRSSWLRQRASNRWGDRSALGEPINLAVSCFSFLFQRFSIKVGTEITAIGIFDRAGRSPSTFPPRGPARHASAAPRAMLLDSPGSSSPTTPEGDRASGPTRFVGWPASATVLGQSVIQRLKPVGHSGYHAPVEAWRSAPCIRVGPSLSLTDFSDLSQFRMLRNWPDRPLTS
jgi:hypothetical protein